MPLSSDQGSQLGWFGKRLTEPSTYASLAALLAAWHVTIPTGVPVLEWIQIIGMFVGGGLGVVLPEKK